MSLRWRSGLSRKKQNIEKLIYLKCKVPWNRTNLGFYCAIHPVFGLLIQESSIQSPLKPNPKPSPACPTLLRRLRLHWNRKKSIKGEQLVTRRRLQVGCDFLNPFLTKDSTIFHRNLRILICSQKSSGQLQGGFCWHAFKSDSSVWNQRGYMVFTLISCVYQFLDHRCICFFLIFLIMLVILIMSDPCPGRIHCPWGRWLFKE